MTDIHNLELHRVLNRLFIWIPVGIIVFFYVYHWIGTPITVFTMPLKGNVVLWKQIRNPLLYFYELGFVLVIVEMVRQKVNTIPGFLKYSRNWIIGLLLLLFSYAIAGIAIDLTYVMYYLFLVVTNQRQLLNPAR